MTYAKFGAVLLVVLVVSVLFYKFSMIAANIVGGIVLYFLLAHLLDSFERQGMSERQAYGVLVLAMACGVLAFVLYVSIPLVEQVSAFSRQLPLIVDRFKAQLEQYQMGFPLAGQAMAKLQERVSSDLEALFSLLGSVATSVITILIIAIILLSSRKTLRDTLLAPIPNDYFEVTVTIANDVLCHVQDFIWAKSAETAAMIVVYAMGFYAIGLPQPLLLGFLGGVLNIIPYLGPLLTVPPLVLAGMVGGGFQLVGPALGVLVIAQLIDNVVLQTWLVSRLVDIHPFMVVILTLVSGEVLGVVGMIMAVPAYVITKTILVGVFHYLKAVERHALLYQQEA
ncbi:AI-2E family transporter [Candidatus Woesearchaeota archaeon]|nr:AI-2E family transporter [Candidatus Woesearchaeota archaeon]